MAAWVTGGLMLREVAKPVVLILCILSLFAVFQAAFFEPGADLPSRLRESLGLLGLAGTICVLSGVVFNAPSHAGRHRRPGRLSATLPVRLFCWGSGLMVLLFLLSLYLQHTIIFHRDGYF